MDENTGRISSDGVAAHHDIDVAVLLEVRIEDRFAGCGPARLPLQQVETVTAAPRLSKQYPPKPLLFISH
jgi:hypothetical protein